MFFQTKGILFTHWIGQRFPGSVLDLTRQYLKHLMIFCQWKARSSVDDVCSPGCSRAQGWGPLHCSWKPIECRQYKPINYVPSDKSDSFYSPKWPAVPWQRSRRYCITTPKKFMVSFVRKKAAMSCLLTRLLEGPGTEPFSLLAGNYWMSSIQSHQSCSFTDKSYNFYSPHWPVAPCQCPQRDCVGRPKGSWFLFREKKAGMWFFAYRITRGTCIVDVHALRVKPVVCKLMSGVNG